ncbi:hypothetical protein CERZMDRAFT_82023 [Cercospora zeae-maydis SCOH1-5]|uniref:Zinc finger PHD-type domain-containing protein n=1 Tax=Cercospora zeae-maydis SCOH1-5 TaxID=717836 RepID=A0A6A6FR67_9PEZI|nr:hypothetical protein CERZMDRAFT_82023 [Cercospora zeae-maydis SCOH1-5]
MDSSRYFTDAVERAARVADAHLEVRDWEPGLILNETYNKHEYILRRHGHLGRHPDTRSRPRLAQTAFGDANTIFEHETHLSIQVVRQLELRHAFEQLTPFPTDTNTATVDGYFGLYAPFEWQPETQTAEEVAIALVGNQDADKNPPLHPHRVAWDLMATTVRNPPQKPETLNQIINDLSYPLGTITTPPPQYAAEGGMAVVAHSPASPQVESQYNTGEKRSADALLVSAKEEELKTVASPPGARSAKRPKLETTNVETFSVEPRRKTGEKRPADSPSPSHDNKAIEATGSPSPARPSKRPRTETPPPAKLLLPGIVSGKRLPKTRKEAFDSAMERKQVLQRAQLIINPNVVAENVDLPPEFHSPANFTEAERTAMANNEDDNGPVRCICGENHGVEGKEDWIQCDGENCGVWQHVVCMEDGVGITAAKRQAKTYLCQVCDPWRHRRLLQRVRKETPDPVGRAERERNEATAEV